MQATAASSGQTDEAQAKHPAFVLVPSYTETAVNDKWETTEEVPMTLRLVKNLIAEKRLMLIVFSTTGQSMGGMDFILPK